MATIFAVFPLTDTDIWWHLACAREWVTTWTPVREPVVNVHYYFQQVVGLVYRLGGAQALVIFKAILWGTVFALFVLPLRNGGKILASKMCMVTALLFLFRYQLEVRPVVFSLLFLGIYWNVLPKISENKTAVQTCGRERNVKIALCVMLLVIQWFWCKTQGLFILGPLFTTGVFLVELFKAGEARGRILPWGMFPLAMYLMPFLHREGLSLFLYPLGLLDRLLGLSPTAAIFASEIAENRSPITLLLSGENTLVSIAMVVLVFVTIGHEILRVLFLRRNILQESSSSIVHHVSLLIVSILALVAERNFVLFLPVFLSLWINACPRQVILPSEQESVSRFTKIVRTVAFVSVFFVVGLWLRSLQAYDRSMVSFQRVPVAAVEWMKSNPHSGRLFNDDRAGGYLTFTNPADSIYMDGRFILKTADFFEQYLHMAENPDAFLRYADSSRIDRAVFPLQYYARWDKVINALQTDSSGWYLAYRDEYFCIFQR